MQDSKVERHMVPDYISTLKSTQSLLMDERDLLQKVWDQNFAEMREMDSQRTMLSNIILVLDVALIGLLTKASSSQHPGFLATALVLLGGFGIFSVAKYYERYKYYKNRTETLLRELSNLVGKDVPSLLADADSSHANSFPARVKFKVYLIWYFVHFFAVFAGVFLGFIALCG